MNRKWNEKTTLEKTMDIISGIALCVWLIFEALERKSIAYASMGAYISIIVICICEAISFWNVKRALSYVAIAGSVLLIATIVLEAMLIK